MTREPSVDLFLASLGEAALLELCHAYEDCVRVVAAGAERATVNLKVKATAGTRPGKVVLQSTVSLSQPQPKPDPHLAAVFVIEGRIVTEDPQASLFPGER